MSYADVTARGPKQSPEEARAPPVPSLPHDDSESASLIDVDSPHVSSVKSDFQEQAVKTETQAERIERELAAKAREEAAKVSAAADSAKKQAATRAKKAKEVLRADGKKLSENRDNPVVIGNAIIWTIAAAAVGYGAYQKHSEGKLDWKLAGTVAGVVGAFGVADYFGSKWLLENKYPPK